MTYTRRDFAKLALAGLPAAALLERPLFGSAMAQAKPNSLINGVQIGVITYSYRSMPDQSGEATLKYVLGSGINAIELMDGPVEAYLGGRPTAPQRAGGPGRAGAAGGRGEAAAPKGPTPYEQLMAGTMPSCPPPAAQTQAGGARGGARAEPTPEQAAYQQQMQAYQADLKKWRTSVSLDKVKALRKMYNDAGVTIYAYKADGMQKNLQTSNEELDYLFTVAAALGATHTTMELPAPTADGTALMKRMAQFGEKHKIYVGYHTHAQGSMSAFDEALAMSKWNMSNVDLGHFVAGGNKGGSVIQYLEKFHDRIVSFHLKDRTLPEHCSLTVPFGKGDGQLKEILQTIKKNQWKFPATIELEYPIPAGSDAVAEVRKCLDFSRQALA